MPIGSAARTAALQTEGRPWVHLSAYPRSRNPALSTPAAGASPRPPSHKSGLHTVAQGCFGLRYELPHNIGNRQDLLDAAG